MSKHWSPGALHRFSGSAQACVVEGLPQAIDDVAEAAPASHGFLRRAWFDAALQAYGGRARTLIVTRHDRPLLALPMHDIGPRFLGLSAISGCFWPFRSFPAAAGIDDTGGKQAAGGGC